MKEHFDHRKAYEDDGEMMKLIKPVLDAGDEHGCPIMVIACTHNNEDTYGLGCWKSFRTINEGTQENFFPQVMRIAEHVLQQPPEVRDIILNIIGLAAKANSTEEQMMQMLQQMIAEEVSEVTNLLREHNAS